MNARVFLVVAVAVICSLKMPRILELFCGTKSVGRALAAGWEVVSLDIVLKFKPTILRDIRSWDYTTFPGPAPSARNTATNMGWRPRQA